MGKLVCTEVAFLGTGTRLCRLSGYSEDAAGTGDVHFSLPGAQPVGVISGLSGTVGCLEVFPAPQEGQVSPWALCFLPGLVSMKAFRRWGVRWVVQLFRQP